MKKPSAHELAALPSSVLLACALLASGCGEKPKPPAPPRQETMKPVQAGVATQAAPARVSTLTAYYHFDDPRGSTLVADKTGAHPGRASAGVALGTEGQIGTAADLSSARGGQIIVMDPLNLFTNTVTIAGWVKRRGAQQPGAALVFCRGGDVVSGLQIGRANELAYVWSHDGKIAWKSGLTLPDDTWTFIALVVEPEKATLYMGMPGAALRAAEHEVPHAVAEFSGALTFGRDPIIGEGFEGALDEFGIWKNALGRDEVEKLFIVGQKLAAVKTPPSQAPAAASASPVAAKAEPVKFSGEYERGVALYNNAVDAFRDYMQTRKNPAVLGKIEENMRACIAIFEQCKARPEPGTDPQDMIDRCNKMIFDVHMTKQVSR